jgi:hypothetical protein
MCRPVARRQRSMTNSASRRAAFSAFSLAAPALMVEPSCPNAHPTSIEALVAGLDQSEESEQPGDGATSGGPLVRSDGRDRSFS